MNKTRLEAFTDGVFAVVVTLLVLDIKLPEATSSQNLESQIIHLIPALSTYILSFTIAGMYWVAHHLASDMFKKIDTRVMWLNIFHLTLVALIPFSTSLLSHYAESPLATVVYGVNILAINLSGWFIITYLYKHQNLASQPFTPTAYRIHQLQYLFVAFLYGLGLLVSVFNPEFTVIFYILITLFLIAGTLFPSISWRRFLK